MGVAFFSGVNVGGKPGTISTMEPLRFADGQHGVWVLKKSNVFVYGFYGIEDQESYLSADSLSLVERHCERLASESGTAK